MSEVTIHHGDSRDVLKTLADNSIDSVVTDPPYALVSIGKRFGADNAAPAKSDGASGVYARASAGFMGQRWDTGETAFSVEFWAEVMRVLKPGGHIIAASGTRTYHRLACAIEDAGFEIRDMVSWLYGSGFPKSHNVGKGIDASILAGSARTTDMRRLAMGEDYAPSGRGRANFDHGGASVMNGATGGMMRTAQAAQWQGWGTALKPACEPWVLARKPLISTVAANVLAHGTGALNIDGCRVGMSSEDAEKINAATFRKSPPSVAIGKFASEGADKPMAAHDKGRWPANVIHDGSEEVVGSFPETHSAGAARIGSDDPRPVKGGDGIGFPRGHTGKMHRVGDPAGSVARFFYSAKADAEDRLGSKHPTVKPVDLMAYLCRLVTPPGGTVLDPFAGSGSTGVACLGEGFDAILIEREDQYVADIRRRIAWAKGEGRTTALEMARMDTPEKLAAASGDGLPLFGSVA